MGGVDAKLERPPCHPECAQRARDLLAWRASQSGEQVPRSLRSLGMTTSQVRHSPPPTSQVLHSHPPTLLVRHSAHSSVGSATPRPPTSLVRHSANSCAMKRGSSSPV